MKVRALLSLFSLFLLVIAMPAGAGEKLAMKVSPAVAFAPANLVVRAFVASDPDNRAIEVVAESEDFYRSSQMSLDGDKAPRTNVFEFRSLPTGAYQVSAVLIGTNGQRALVRQQISVMATGPGDH
jgi:hypothetical protein